MSTDHTHVVLHLYNGGRVLAPGVDITTLSDCYHVLVCSLHINHSLIIWEREVVRFQLCPTIIQLPYTRQRDMAVIITKVAA